MKVVERENSRSVQGDWKSLEDLCELRGYLKAQGPKGTCTNDFVIVFIDLLISNRKEIDELRGGGKISQQAGGGGGDRFSEV